MTTAAPTGTTPFFLLNVTTKEEDSLYQSKWYLLLAWQLAEGWRDRCHRQLLVQKSRAWALETDGLGLGHSATTCQLGELEHVTSVLCACFLICKMGILAKLPQKVGVRSKTDHLCKELRLA